MSKTRVMFRTDKTQDEDGVRQVTAVFPDEHERGNSWGCYARIGQHGICSRDWVYSKTRPSTEAEAAPLLAELESIGYDVKVIQRVRN